MSIELTVKMTICKPIESDKLIRLSCILCQRICETMVQLIHVRWLALQHLQK